jgi:PncC family amidohydrolase
MLEIQLGELLRARGLTLSTAESCTGGLLGHRLTNVAGSSAYYLGGLVVYSNKAKMKLLGVPETMLQAVGAVSAEVAQTLAQACRELFASDLALSVTGIAGPGGGTAEKPVGLTYIGLATPDGVQVARHVWQGGRESNKSESAEAAFRMALAYLNA